MLRKSNYLLLLIAFMFLQACAPKAQEDCGFVQNVYGERISWKGEIPVKMRIHESVPDEMIPAILSAAETWNKTLGKKVLVVDVGNKIQGPETPLKDGKNVIYFMSGWESGKSSEQGRTSVYWLGDVIKETDIRLNGANFDYYWESTNITTASRLSMSSAVNIEALVLHEMGHVLGLKHRDMDGSAMHTYLRPKEDRTELGKTDVAALQCEY